jgi:chromatin remodeling complex protein RSC6
MTEQIKHVETLVVSAPVQVSAQVSAPAPVSAQAKPSLKAEIKQLKAEIKQLKAEIKQLKAENIIMARNHKNEIKKIEKNHQAEMKQNIPKKQSSVNRVPCGFAKPTLISDELATFLGKEIGIEMARTAVTSEISTYIKANNLQDKANGRIINPDDKLTKLLNIKVGEELTYLNLQKFMKHHFIKAVVEVEVEAEELEAEELEAEEEQEAEEAEELEAEEEPIAEEAEEKPTAEKPKENGNYKSDAGGEAPNNDDN